MLDNEDTELFKEMRERWGEYMQQFLKTYLLIIIGGSRITVVTLRLLYGQSGIKQVRN